MNNDNCCNISCDNPLDKQYWDAQYQAKKIGWDIGTVSPPIQSYIDTIEDKSVRILIPGCGNSYEADYLLAKGFTNITVIDIAPTLVENLQLKHVNNKNIKIVLGDFFEHQGEYDLIIEQTFFCALQPYMRQQYVWKMHQLLSKKGILVGVLFNRTFEISPPFGGSEIEYQELFQDAFHLLHIDECKNSISKRKNTELFVEFKRNNQVVVNLYSFEGVTCMGCMNTVTKMFLEIEGILNVSMSLNFSEVLIVSTDKINLGLLQSVINYDRKYKIKKIKY